MLIRRSSPFCKRVQAAMNVGIIFLIVLGNRNDNRLRFLRGGGVVQIDQPVVIHFLRQNREIGLYFTEIAMTCYIYYGSAVFGIAVHISQVLRISRRSRFLLR